jgi:hypothetical protein
MYDDPFDTNLPLKSVYFYSLFFFSFEASLVLRANHGKSHFENP